MNPGHHRPDDADFWDRVGATFPSLKGARSTAYYLECERRLLRHLGSLHGRTLFKTDLWDEAKNTEILRWAAEEGARPIGIDLSHGVVAEARRVLAPHRPALAMADLRSLPFADDAFDLAYSMGTIEHFSEYAAAVREIHRVLKPGGRAIIGVPNKLDPFLRPLMVDLLNRVGGYAYGREKSFTRRALRRLARDAGFQVVAESGILFMPGWLRMLDLWCHTRGSPLARLTGPAVVPFAWLSRHVPALRRHGYLIACVVEKPR
jgi:SAM-dependent methyltransferase